MMTDEQLANPDNHGSIARAQVWCGNHYEYPLIASIARELLAARKALREIERHHVERNRKVGRPEAASHTLSVVRKALDEATNAARPQE